MPGLRDVGTTEVTVPEAMRPEPPWFSLAKMKMESPRAIRLPPYIVLCSENTKVEAFGSVTSALIAYTADVVTCPSATLEVRRDRPAEAGRRAILARAGRG